MPLAAEHFYPELRQTAHVTCSPKMSNSTTIELKNIDAEDIGDVLKKVEKSFDFQFDDTELMDIKTFGELCDIIVSKIPGDNIRDCTTQQAFYKLRDAIATTLYIDKDSLSIDTRLQELFPKRQRRKQIKVVERILGFKTKVLRPKQWVTTTLFFLSLVSIVGLFISWQTGLACLVVSIVGLSISNKLGNEFDLATIGQLVEKIAREHYKQARRNPATVNRIEVTKKVKLLFMTDLNLEEEVLARQATFA
jgi:hypothetical protein